MSWEDLWYGRQPSFARTAWRLALSPLSGLYRLGVEFDAWAWRTGLRRAVRVDGVRIISVGNLVAGGAGKTPVVMFLARWAQAVGHRVAVLSRGYRRESNAVLSLNSESLASASEVGDEPRLIARSCPGVQVWVGSDRVDLARRARQAGATLAILDDGFQHRRLTRDVDLVVVPPGAYGGVLPAGPLREAPTALARATVLWLRDGAQADHPRCVRTRHFISAVRAPDGTTHALDSLSGAPVVALSGIARPEGFHSSVEQTGAVVAERFVFPDHHRFSARELATVRAAAKRHQARVLTTDKDRERLPEDFEAWSLVLDVELTDGLELLADTLGLARNLVPAPVR